MKFKTGFLYSDRFTCHQTGPTHPERPDRVSYVHKHLRRQPVFGNLIPVEPQPAPLEWIREVHSPDYVRRIEDSCRRGDSMVDSPDTPISEESFEIARLSAGAAPRLVDCIMEGKLDNGFALMRPPGHHAERDRALGFCLFNNVAIAARYIQKKYGLKKILIVDWDVHHGNGTQNYFYEDPSVFYFSVHQYPFYPGTGSAEEKGRGAGLGTTVNVPLPAGCGDGEYLEVFKKSFYPRAVEFAPEFLLISAGFDAHACDPLGQMEVTREGYKKMTMVVQSVAEKCAGSRIVSILEGGYDLEALADSVQVHLESLRAPESLRSGPL